MKFKNLEELKIFIQERRANLFKTFSKQNGGICRFFTRGECFLGDKCTFRHEKTEKTMICSNWLKRCCPKNFYCDFLHVFSPERMPICVSYLNNNLCNNKSCVFIHKEDDNNFLCV